MRSKKMRRTRLSLTLLLVLAMVQISNPFSFAGLVPGLLQAHSIALTEMDTIPLDTQTTLVFNSTHDTETFSLVINTPVQLGFNVSVFVDAASPFLHLDVDMRQTEAQYFPHLNDYIHSVNNFWSDSFPYWLLTGNSYGEYEEFVTINPGMLFIYFDLYWPNPSDQVTVNFTLNQLFDLSSATEYTWDQLQDTSWPNDGEWAGSKFTIPEVDLYNVSIYGELDYTTTAGWLGDSFFQPFTKLELMDGIYGENLLIDFYNPWFDIPAGAGSGTANWSEWNHYRFPAEDYYFFGNIGGFEFLNGSQVTMQMAITPVSMPMLAINQTAELSFNSSLPSNVAYVGITAHQGYRYSLYFDNPIGANWSVECYDVYGWWLPPSYFHYQDSTSYSIVEDRFENCFVYAIPMMGSTPTPSLTGEDYYELYSFGGTDVVYVNDTATGASMASNGYQNTIETFYIQVFANPFGGIPTTEFNITLNFEAYAIPLLDTSGTTVAVNQTIGPFYQAFALPVVSGFEYEITAWASDYNMSGVAGVFIAPAPQGYLDWQWSGYYPLFLTTPTSGIPFQVTNVNDTATIRFIAVRHTTLYVGVVGMSMTGPPPSDTTEMTVNITTTAPEPYAMGTVMTETLQNMEFKTYSVNLVAGTTYRLSFSLDASGNYALLSFFDGNGYTPFALSIFTLWAEVASDFLNYTNTYTALATGPMTIVLVADGTAHFSLLAVGEAPGSFVLGLIIGLIFMVTAVIIVFVVMRRRRY